MSSHSFPSAPPTEYHHGAEGGNLMNADFPNKRQSQAVSPNAFSYAPGLFFPQNQPPNASAPAPSGPSSRGSTGATAPYPSGNGAHPMAAPLSHPPPDYGTSAYPQGVFLCSFMGEFYCHKGWSLYIFSLNAGFHLFVHKTCNACTQNFCYLSNILSNLCVHAQILSSLHRLYILGSGTLVAAAETCWNLPLLMWQLPAAATSSAITSCRCDDLNLLSLFFWKNVMTLKVVARSKKLKLLLPTSSGQCRKNMCYNWL